MKPEMGTSERFARFNGDISTAGSYRQAPFPVQWCTPQNGLPGQQGPARDSRTAAQVGRPADPVMEETCREPHGAGVVRLTVRAPQGVAGRAGCAAAARSPARCCWSGWAAATTTVARRRPGRRPSHRYADRQRRRRYGAGPTAPRSTRSCRSARRSAPSTPVDDAPAMSIPLLPGERTAARRIKFAVVNACTLTSLMLGMLAIFLAMQGDVRIAALCLIACVVFDGLDGALARKFGVASPFGAQMDSLADMCSFGLAAPVVVYASLAGSVSARRRRGGLRPRRGLRRDPARPVQRLAEGRPVLLRRADHHGGGRARPDRA